MDKCQSSTNSEVQFWMEDTRSRASSPKAPLVRSTPVMTLPKDKMESNVQSSSSSLKITKWTTQNMTLSLKFTSSPRKTRWRTLLPTPTSPGRPSSKMKLFNPTQDQERRFPRRILLMRNISLSNWKIKFGHISFKTNLEEPLKNTFSIGTKLSPRKQCSKLASSYLTHWSSCIKPVSYITIWN